ncbi:MraY family glycosyltransferase [Pseudomonas lundensis]|uniref:MraY family glycosyltransferase n=1 Tax=Pseudomonas lundensis TaxID=86185 RepID=UPI001867D320|nr:glycosyltransferase family 4 protein [Pseudomonas lundensis]
MIQYWLLPIVFIVSIFGTSLLRGYSLANSLIDIPNARSSHTVPTPRGGGVAIVLSFMLGLLFIYLFQNSDRAVILSILVSGTLTAVIGFLDDHGHIPACWRLLGHFTASFFALYIIHNIPDLSFFGFTLKASWVTYTLACLYLVWMLNLYNFMDGIDGLSSVQAIFVCLGGSFLYFLSGQIELVWEPLLLASAVSGFLYWNFPPARIFMGDAGSGFLGITLGLFSLQAGLVDPVLFWGWLILMGVFITDSTLTLLVRVLRGEKIYEAHRSHAYQFASRYLKSHLRVTSLVIAINIFFLLPIASLVTLKLLDGFLGVLLAYIPLVLIALFLKAGRAEN